MNTQLFRSTLSQFATGVTVVMTRTAQSALHGMTVNSFASVSLDPPLILFCAENQSKTLPAVEASRRFTVSILSAQQEQESRQFAVVGPQDELFSRLALNYGIDHIPYLRESLAYLDCAVDSIIPAGDHHIVIGRVDQLATLEPGSPLLYFESHYYPPQP